MLGIESSKDLKKADLFDSLFQSIEQAFGYNGKSLEEQAEAFFRDTNTMALTVAFRQNGAEKILKDLPSDLQSYILEMLEEAEKRSKQGLQAWKKREEDRQARINDYRKMKG